jgi:hypothetical protein
MKITLVKNLNNTFSIAYNSDYDKAKKMKAGVFFECDVKKKRNYMFHKKYFALINMVFENQEHFNNIDDLRDEITIESGFFKKYENLQGDIIKKPLSINFSNMDELKFNELYSATIDTIIKYFKFKKEDILENIEQYF